MRTPPPKVKRPRARTRCFRCRRRRRCTRNSGITKISSQRSLGPTIARSENRQRIMDVDDSLDLIPSLLSYCCLSATSFLVKSGTTIGSEMPRRQSAGPLASGSIPSPFLRLMRRVTELFTRDSSLARVSPFVFPPASLQDAFTKGMLIQ